MKANQQQRERGRAPERKGGWLRMGLAMLAAALAGCALIAAVGSFTGFAAAKQISNVAAWSASGPMAAIRLPVPKPGDRADFANPVTERMQGLSDEGFAARLNDCSEGLFADFRVFLLAAACISLAGYGIAYAAAESRNERRRKTAEHVLPI